MANDFRLPLEKYGEWGRDENTNNVAFAHPYIFQLYIYIKITKE
jgi:hypothetical protein